MINNNLINFNTPIIFDQHFLDTKNRISKALICIGSAADRYLSTADYCINATTKEKLPIEGHVWKTVLKIASYILTAFILPVLPAFAFIAKLVYRNWALEQMLAMPSKELPIDQQKQKIFHPPVVEIDGGLLKTERDRIILKHLKAFTQSSTPEDKLNILFELKKLADENKEYDPLLNQLMHKIFYPEPPSIEKIEKQKKEYSLNGYILVKDHNHRKPLPDQFLNFSDFVDREIEKTIEENSSSYSEWLSKLSQDLQETVKVKHDKLLLEKGHLNGNKQVKTRTTSQRRFVVLSLDETTGGNICFAHANVNDFESGKKHPMADPTKWKQLDEKNDKIRQLLQEQLIEEDISNSVQINIIPSNNSTSDKHDVNHPLLSTYE
jgi:hypothetical protein